MRHSHGVLKTTGPGELIQLNNLARGYNRASWDTCGGKTDTGLCVAKETGSSVACGIQQGARFYGCPVWCQVF